MNFFYKRLRLIPQLSFGAFIFMDLIYHCPRMKYGCNPSAVYKMTFDTGHFYIGSSKKVKTRFVIWRTNLKRLDLSSKIIADILPSVKEVYFEIIELVDVKFLKEKETHYIGQHITNELFMNRCPTAFDNSNIKPLPPHLIKFKIKIKKPLKGKWIAPLGHIFRGSKQLIKFSTDGEGLTRYVSIASACRDNNVTDGDMNKHLRGVKYPRLKGFIFKYAEAAEKNNFGL